MASPATGARPPGPTAQGRPAGHPASHPGAGQPGPGQPGYGVRAQAAALPYADHAARDHQGAVRPAQAAAADLGRGRHGRARRDDRAHLGQGAGPLDRRVHRGRAAPDGGRHHHGAADAALRVPRPARHREDDGGPGAGQDLLCLRPAPDAGGHRGAPGRPGRRVPGRDRDQDQRARRFRAGRRAVHRRGVQPGQRGRRAGRPVRHRSGPDAAQAGRGQPREPHHHPGRLREADGDVPGLQPRPGVPVRDPAEVPELLAGRR